MDRLLRVEVDRGSWPNPGPPTIPVRFPPVDGPETFNIPSILLTIGLLTTPAHTSGVSLSEYWAWVRYLHAIAADDDLRLTRGFWDLDAHQKTILSDDFGMGVPIYWLLDKLELSSVCDGRYFVQRLAATVGAQALKTKKRGPDKTPDFVAQDINGVWHVIECKGTQSGSTYLSKQIGERGPPPTGALAQKSTIRFPPGHTGQRLACALSLGVEGGREASFLRIVDPEGEEEVRLTEDDLPKARDAVTRAMAAKSLRLAGFEAASLAMAAPSGIRPDSRPAHGRIEERRREAIREKTERAREELGARTGRNIFTADGEKYRGREARIELPAPVVIGKRTIRALRIRQGVQVGALEELSRAPLIEDPLEQADTPWRESLGITKVRHSSRQARLSIGQFFVSEISTTS